MADALDKASKTVQPPLQQGENVTAHSDAFMGLTPNGYTPRKTGLALVSVQH